MNSESPAGFLVALLIALVFVMLVVVLILTPANDVNNEPMLITYEDSTRGVTCYRLSSGNSLSCIPWDQQPERHQ